MPFLLLFLFYTIVTFPSARCQVKLVFGWQRAGDHVNKFRPCSTSASIVSIINIILNNNNVHPLLFYYIITLL
jgi:hypothetical protein